MSEAIVKYDAGFSYNQEQINLIKSQIAKGATDDELAMFTMLAQKYGLDPFLKEIWFIKSVKKKKTSNGDWDYPRLKNGEIDYSTASTLIYTSRDGYLKIAQRDSEFAGIISFVVREGDTFEVDAQNYTVTHKFGLKRGQIIGAWAKVDHKARKPVIAFVEFKEYNEANSTVWKQYPSAMIQKVAEVFALKRQFGISGLVTKEEMSRVVEEDKPEGVIEVEVIDTITDEQLAELSQLIEAKNAKLDKLLNHYSVGSLSHLTQIQYEDAKSILNEPKKEKTA